MSGENLWQAPPKLPAAFIMLQNYLEWLHNKVVGIGTGSGSLGEGSVAGWHSGDNRGHGNIIQGADVDDLSLTIPTVTEPDADVTYGAEEMDLINQMKVVINAQAGLIETLETKQNEILDTLRNSNSIG